MPLDPVLLYNIAQKGAAASLPSAHFYQSMRGCLEHDVYFEQVLFGAPPSFGGENSPPNGVRREIKQLRRGAGNRSARVLILTKRRCQGREKFCERSLANFFGASP